MLWMTIGCPGSGKSTFAERSLPETLLRLERDRFRECLYGSRQAYHMHQHEARLKSAVITQAMLSAMIYWPTPAWVVTDTNMHEASARPFIDHARRVGVPVRLVIFDRPLELLLERNKTRPEEHRVPEPILMTFYEQFQDPEAWWRTASESEFEKVYL